MPMQPAWALYYINQYKYIVRQEEMHPDQQGVSDKSIKTGEVVTWYC